MQFYRESFKLLFLCLLKTVTKQFRNDKILHLYKLILMKAEFVLHTYFFFKLLTYLLMRQVLRNTQKNGTRNCLKSTQF